MHLRNPFRKAPPPSTPSAPEDERAYVASQWQLMWWKFRRHRAANVAAVIVIMLYVIALLVEPIAAYSPDKQDVKFAFAPPTPLHFFDTEGKFHLRPFIYAMTRKRDLETLSLVFTEDKTQLFPIHFFIHGDPYSLLGVVKSDIHLFGLQTKDQKVLIMGGDGQGRDEYSRLIYGTRLSMSIGLVGVLVSFVLGILIGGISGFYGGVVDTFIQRIIEFLRSLPTIPLWMALSAALPANWPPVRMYFGITVILSLIGWTGLARVVRGRFLALREEDFIMAAKINGSSEMRIILRHMVPSFLSHIIAALTLAVPDMILAETALSFLGLGLRYPAISWGVLLQDAQNIRSVASAPWLLWPGVAVVVAVLALNFLGDGLRDAADPYSR